jgi:RecB family exonuclease
LFDKFCRLCEHQSTCRFISEFMNSEWANGCRFYSPKAEARLLQEAT